MQKKGVRGRRGSLPRLGQDCSPCLTVCLSIEMERCSISQIFKGACGGIHCCPLNASCRHLIHGIRQQCACLLLAVPSSLSLFLFQAEICLLGPWGGERCSPRCHTALYTVTSHSFKVPSPKVHTYARRWQKVKINYDFSFSFFHHLNM